MNSNTAQETVQMHSKSAPHPEHQEHHPHHHKNAEPLGKHANMKEQFPKKHGEINNPGYKMNHRTTGQINQPGRY